MAQWQELNNLCMKNVQFQDRVNDLFGRINFPYKIRSAFAEWIESKDWNISDVSSDTYKQKAMYLFKELMMMIEKRVDSMQVERLFDLEKNLDIKKARDKLKKAFDGNYGTFVDVVRQCLQAEKNLIDSCRDDGTEVKPKWKFPEVATENVEVNQKLNQLLQLLTDCESMAQDVQCKQEEFHLEYATKFERLQQLIPNANSSPEIMMRKTEIEREMNRQAEENFNRRNRMVDEMSVLANGLIEILRMIWKEIENWQTEQKKMIAALSKPKEGALDILDKMCDEGGHLLVKTIQLLKTVDDNIFKKMEYSNPDTKKEDLEKIFHFFKMDVLPEHLKRIFVVERNVQDRVLKVNGGKSLGFSMSVRILGGNNLGMNYNQPKLMMSLFSEKDIPETNEYKDGVCRIENGQERTFSVNRGNKACVAHFHSVMLKNVKRPDKDKGKNDELVTEHKYAFVFYTAVTVLNELFKLKVISLPVILTSQTSQEIMAKGTLIWDAAFSDEVRNPFEYRDSVPWGDFATVLNALFVQNTGRGLDKEQLEYLAKMVFRHNESKKTKTVNQTPDFDSKPITYNQAIRDRLSNKDYSLWKWVYACMNLISIHIKKEWQDGRIFGFISKSDAGKKLAGTPVGTFLIRFSESKIESSQKSDICGLLSVAVMQIDPETGKMKLFHINNSYLAPKDIQEKGLVTILDAMEVADYANPKQKVPLLRHLWPDVTTTFPGTFGVYSLNEDRVPAVISKGSPYRHGRLIIEIFLSDNQRRRSRTDSTDDNSFSYSNPASVQSATSIDTNFSPPSSIADDFMMATFVPRPLAAVQPSPIFQYPNSDEMALQQQADCYTPVRGAFELKNQCAFPMLHTDADGDLVIPNMAEDIELGLPIDEY